MSEVLPPQRKSRSRWTVIGLSALIFGCVCPVGIIWEIRKVALLMKRHEFALHASYAVCGALDTWIERHGYQSWPSSWADLETMSVDGGMFVWPRDADQVRQYIDVDFVFRWDDLAVESPPVRSKEAANDWASQQIGGWWEGVVKDRASRSAK